MANDAGGTTGSNTTAAGGTAGSSTSGLGYGPTADSFDPRGDSLDVTGGDTASSDLSWGLGGDEGFGQSPEAPGTPAAVGGVGVSQESGMLHLAGAEAPNADQDADLDSSTTDTVWTDNDGGVTPGYTSAGPARGS